MRIVKHGPLTPLAGYLWHKEFTCSKCESVIEVNGNDLTFVADSRDGDAYTFDCPACRTKNWIDAGFVPTNAVPGR